VAIHGIATHARETIEVRLSVNLKSDVLTLELRYMQLESTFTRVCRRQLVLNLPHRLLLLRQTCVKPSQVCKLLLCQERTRPKTRHLISFCIVD